MLAGSKEIFSICNSLVIQYESRKQTETYITPVPWTGTVAHTSRNEVMITGTEVKWEKMRSLVLELETLMKEDKAPHKRL